MKIKFNLIEDITSGEMPEVDPNETDEKIWYDTDERKFYGFNSDTQNWEPITGSRANSLMQEYKRQQYLLRHPEKVGDDKAENDRLSRIKARWTGGENGGIGEKIKKNSDEVKEKKKKERELIAKTLEDEQKTVWDTITPAKSAEEIVNDIINDLEYNILDNDETPWDFEPTYGHPNSFTVDPSIIQKSDTYEPQSPDDEDKPKPYVYFFFDRSGSFNGGTKRADGTWTDPKCGAKADFGRNIENALKVAMNDGRLLFKTFFFADDVHTTEPPALREGGNDGDALIRYIQGLIKEDYPSNIVIVTDSDEGTGYSDIAINGGVWIVFCDSTNDSLVEAFDKNECKVIKTYFVEDIWGE